MNRLVAGALGGTLTTVPMTMLMSRLFRSLPAKQQYPLPPREVTEVLLGRADVARYLGDYQITALSLLAHFGYGAATGALYPLLPPSKQPLVGGAGYGAAVWAASYLGWIPAAKILRPATTHPLKRNALMIGAHLVWGAGTALVVHRLLKPRECVRSPDFQCR